jgi:hypothetical protein
MEIDGVRWVFRGRELPVSKEEVARSCLSVWPRSGHDEPGSHRSLDGWQWRMGENLACGSTD